MVNTRDWEPVDISTLGTMTLGKIFTAKVAGGTCVVLTGWGVHAVGTDHHIKPPEEITYRHEGIVVNPGTTGLQFGDHVVLEN